MKEGVPQATGKMEIEPVIDSIHIAEAVLYMVKLPVTVNVPTMTVMANKMPYVGRG
jgi:NADP-dependent 3-hydroxy acid dehydrogenase YdfG